MNKQQSTDELRSSVRFPIKLPVAVTTEARQEHRAETENISAGGVLFTVDAEMAPGSKIEFAIAMPATVLGTSSDVMVKCVGRVVRCAEEGNRKAVAAVIDEYRFDRH
ncbi:MAG TPA: PilZ domain-containing protein [Terriglobales bacterium]|nr:PilZ domain-containing protein [Terriglobales bacterium]